MHRLKNKICPFMSFRIPESTIQSSFVFCQGPECVAFNPTDETCLLVTNGPSNRTLAAETGVGVGAGERISKADLEVSGTQTGRFTASEPQKSNTPKAGADGVSDATLEVILESWAEQVDHWLTTLRDAAESDDYIKYASQRWDDLRELQEKVLEVLEAFHKAGSMQERDHIVRKHKGDDLLARLEFGVSEFLAFLEGDDRRGYSEQLWQEHKRGKAAGTKVENGQSSCGDPIEDLCMYEGDIVAGDSIPMEVVIAALSKLKELRGLLATDMNFVRNTLRRALQDTSLSIRSDTAGRLLDLCKKHRDHE